MVKLLYNEVDNEALASGVCTYLLICDKEVVEEEEDEEEEEE